MLGTILLVLFLVLFLFTLPTWPYSHKWGYGPTACFGIVSMIIALLILSHRL